MQYEKIVDLILGHIAQPYLSVHTGTIISEGGNSQRELSYLDEMTL